MLKTLINICMQVGPRPVWKDAQHPFRSDQQIQLRGIPTLAHYTEDDLGARLSSELEKAQSPSDAEAVAKHFVVSTVTSSQHTNGNGVL